MRKHILYKLSYSSTIPEDKLGEWYELISDFINKPVTREEFNDIKQKYSVQSASIKGINIYTKAADKLGRELTNPNWG